MAGMTSAVLPQDDRRAQLPDEVAAYVRELIISGAVRPGTFLRMEPIAAVLDVSNTPVREGLLSLRSEGLVRLVPRRGFVVEPFSQQDVHDLFWAQARLACELAARAAKQITVERLTLLEENLHQYDQAVAVGNEQRSIGLAHAFQREIQLAADSVRLTLLLDTATKQLPARFYATIDGEAATRVVHPKLLDALRRRDGRAARSLTEHHILGRADHLIAILEQRGVWQQPEENAS